MRKVFEGVSISVLKKLLIMHNLPLPKKVKTVGGQVRIQFFYFESTNEAEQVQMLLEKKFPETTSFIQDQKVCVQLATTEHLNKKMEREFTLSKVTEGGLPAGAILMFLKRNPHLRPKGSSLLKGGDSSRLGFPARTYDFDDLEKREQFAKKLQEEFPGVFIRLHAKKQVLVKCSLMQNEVGPGKRSKTLEEVLSENDQLTLPIEVLKSLDGKKLVVNAKVLKKALQTLALNF